MQLISWQIARLGSRFGLFFEPGFRRVMHGALGRQYDQPLDLMAGMVETDGTERALPFSQHGDAFHNPEQFERPNSVTFRAYNPVHQLRFELNIHSAFYPQDERLCIMPALYLEMRVNPADDARLIRATDAVPSHVKLFFRIGRDDTTIIAGDDDGRAHLALSYDVPLQTGGPAAHVEERIVSLNENATPEEDGKGLSLDLPVTDIGSGIKWRLVWSAYCGDDVMRVATGDENSSGRFRYTRYWKNIDEVTSEAVQLRDDRLARSRRFEKIMEQAPLRMAQRHLLHQGLQTFYSNTFWIDPRKETDDNDRAQETSRGWFGIWECNGKPSPSLEVEYHVSLFYFTLWPSLLAMQFDRWAGRERAHEESGGGYLHHPESPPVAENANFLSLLQTYTRWTGDLSVLERHGELVQRLANYEKWTDRRDCAFPTVGATADAETTGLAVPRETTMAIRRVAGLASAADLLARLDRHDAADQLDVIVRQCVGLIEDAAWLGDHYARSVDSNAGDVDAWSDADLTQRQHQLTDAYSINTAAALLLPVLIGQAILLDHERLISDISCAYRETLTPYGCAETSTERNTLYTSHNLWRDHLARYLGMSAPAFTQCYWDLQIVHNTGAQSHGYSDCYINETRAFSPRGVATIGYLLAYPRLVIDRLSPGGQRISVDPDRHFIQRWPLLPLADWPAGKIPVCTVDRFGKVKIENDTDPIFVRGEQTEDAVIG